MNLGVVNKFVLHNLLRNVTHSHNDSVEVCGSRSLEMCVCVCACVFVCVWGGGVKNAKVSCLFMLQTIVQDVFAEKFTLRVKQTSNKSFFTVLINSVNFSRTFPRYFFDCTYSAVKVKKSDFISMDNNLIIL